MLKNSLDIELFTVKLNEKGNIDLKLSRDIETSVSAEDKILIQNDINIHILPIKNKIFDAISNEKINSELFTAIINEDGNISLEFSNDIKALISTTELEKLLKDDVNEHLTPIITKLVAAAF